MVSSIISTSMDELARQDEQNFIKATEEKDRV
jgi:hypothetical protein